MPPPVAQVPGYVNGIALAPDGRTLAVFGARPLGPNTGAAIWELRDVAPGAGAAPPIRHAAASLEGDGSRIDRRRRVMWARFTPDGRTLIAGERGGTVRLWDVATRKLIYALPNAPSTDAYVALSPDGALLATATTMGDKPTATVLDLRARRVVFSRQEHVGRINGVAFSPDGKTLVTCGLDQTVKFSNLATGQVAATLKMDDPWLPRFAPDGNRLLVGSFLGVRVLEAPPLSKADAVPASPGRSAAARTRPSLLADKRVSAVK